jgi:hypothetical protein
VGGCVSGCVGECVGECVCVCVRVCVCWADEVHFGIHINARGVHWLVGFVSE